MQLKINFLNLKLMYLNIYYIIIFFKKKINKYNNFK